MSAPAEVHAVHMSSQPYVWRACDSAKGYVAWEQPHEARGVYLVSEGWAYAFSSNAGEVTCPDCLALDASTPKDPSP